MDKYLADDVFTLLPQSLLYVEREQSDGRIRHGLIGMVDLDAYDFTPGSLAPGTAPALPERSGAARRAPPHLHRTIKRPAAM